MKSMDRVVQKTEDEHCKAGAHIVDGECVPVEDTAVKVLVLFVGGEAVFESPFFSPSRPESSSKTPGLPEGLGSRHRQQVCGGRWQGRAQLLP